VKDNINNTTKPKSQLLAFGFLFITFTKLINNPKTLIGVILISVLLLFETPNYYNSMKIIPEDIKHEVKTALVYFPELDCVPINFEFKKNIKKSTMQAQPVFSSLLKGKRHREYNILIIETFKVHDTTFKTKDLPSDVLIGWIGHELGHLMDYEQRSNWNLILFGIKYLFSENSIVSAERSADSFAVKNGMQDYILKTKNFILNHANISESYKNRIKKYYLSPEEIMELVQDN
tara:strand:- start:19861 stop:20559 length:699 start_codon:yes stop_codon:yes gene_type:complete